MRAWTLGCAALALACGEPMGDGDGGGLEEDAGTRRDAGSPDAGPPPELEPATDIGDEDQEIWVFMASHLHTTGVHDCANAPMDFEGSPDCYTSEGITAFLTDALANEASDMIITDHNNIDAWFDPAFVPLPDAELTRYATPLRGTEWSSQNGHMTLLFPSEVVQTNLAAITNGWVFAPGNDEPVASDDDYLNTIMSVHAVGGIVVINHPELSIHSFPESTLGADGVEVGIPPNPLDDTSKGSSISAHSSAEARRFWQRRLFSGERLTGTAGADHHHGAGDIPGLEAPTFGIAVNLVRIDPSLPDTADVSLAVGDPATTIDQRTALMIDAIRRGHVMVVESNASARVYTGADTDGDGRFHDARGGDCITSAESGEIRVRLRITNPGSAFGSTHYNLEVWDQTNETDPVYFVEVDYEDGFEENAAYTIDPNDPFAIEITLPFEPSERRFIRFVLERDVVGPVNDTEVVTNPIYYGDWGDECDGSFPLY